MFKRDAPTSFSNVTHLLLFPLANGINIILIIQIWIYNYNWPLAHLSKWTVCNISFLLPNIPFIYPLSHPPLHSYIATLFQNFSIFCLDYYHGLFSNLPNSKFPPLPIAFYFTVQVLFLKHKSDNVPFLFNNSLPLCLPTVLWKKVKIPNLTSMIFQVQVLHSSLYLFL